MAKRLGYDVTIVDPRTAFATPERFAGIKLIADLPDKVLPGLGIDTHTALLRYSRSEIDDPPLLHALSKDCFYLGALGSKKTHAKRVERLTEQG